jgi:hypothetical protein
MIIGISNLLADGLGMAMSDFLSSKAEVVQIIKKMDYCIKER